LQKPFVSGSFDVKLYTMISKKKSKMIEYTLYGFICLLLFGILFLVFN